MTFKYFNFRTKAYLGDINPYQTTYFLRYIEWCGKAREEFIMNYFPEEAMQVMMHTVNLEHKYVKSVRLFDTIEIEIYLKNVKKTNAQIYFNLYIVNKHGEREVAGYHREKIGITDFQGKICHMPEKMYEAFKKFEIK